MAIFGRVADADNNHEVGNPFGYAYDGVGGTDAADGNFERMLGFRRR